jgi:hypothetical protein
MRMKACIRTAAACCAARLRRASHPRTMLRARAHGAS